MGKVAGQGGEYGLGRSATGQRPTMAHHGRLRHEALLTLARKVHAAALDGDIEHLERTAAYLREALVDHLKGERRFLLRVPPGTARDLARGQARLLSDVSALLNAAVTGCGDERDRCAARAEEVIARLYLQARDERVISRDPAA
jgi:hypothetical protein